MRTTLNAIRAHSPCASGWSKLLAHLGKTGPDDEPLSLITILDSNGLDDALWALRAVQGHDREKRLYAVWCARQVEHLLTDQRSRDALDIAERFARGRATREELEDAATAARAAADASAAYAADAAARAAAADASAADAASAASAASAAYAAYAADAAASAASAADAAAVVYVAAAAARVARAAAARAAYAARVAAARAAYAARVACHTARAAQSAELRRICECIDAGRDPYPDTEV